MSQRLQAADLTARMQLTTGRENVPVSTADLRRRLPAEKRIPLSPAPEQEQAPVKPKEMPSAMRATAPSPAPPTFLRPGTATIERISPPPSLPAELFTHVQRPPQALPVPSERERTSLPSVAADTGIPALQVLDCYVVVEVSPDEVLFIDQHALPREVDMSGSDAEAALARLQAPRQRIQQELSQVERQIVLTRLQVVTVEQRIARLNRSQRPAA